MRLDKLLRPWSGLALRHIPATSTTDVLDTRFAGLSRENRWNDAGSPTFYLAGDEGVLIAEWARHFTVNRAPALQPHTIERAVYRLELDLHRVLDLRDPRVLDALSLTDAPACFLERDIARATARFVRTTTGAEALLVPSVAFLDQPDRWCLVLFLEKLPPLPDLVTRVEPAGVLSREP